MLLDQRRTLELFQQVFARRLVVRPRLDLDLHDTFLALGEGQDVGVDQLSVGRGHAVRQARIGLRRHIPDQLRRKQGAVGDRDDLIVSTMHDQHGDGNRAQILREVGL